jgi:hypothetical protein
MRPIHDLFPPAFTIDEFTPPGAQDAVSIDASSETIPSDDQLTDQAPVKKSLGSRVRRSPANSEAFLKAKTQEALTRISGTEQGVLQLAFPMWDETRRGIPNDIVRSGLFTSGLSTKRKSMRDERVASLSNTEIVYSGDELRQNDLTIWMAIVHLGREKPLGDPIRFTAYRLIKEMKWRHHSETYEAIRQCIERLKFTSVKISRKDKKSHYTGSLVRDFAFDEVDEKGKDCWVVRLEPAIAKLFLSDTTTLIEWEQRMKIGTRAALALWAHSFFSTHSDCIPYSVAKLHELSKSDDKKLSNFRARLRLALETLVKVELLTDFSINRDIVVVKRTRAYPQRTTPLLSAAA